MTPWELASKSEHSQQRALFAWANCAALYGFGMARHADAYSVSTRKDLIEAYGLVGGSYTPVPALKLLYAIHNQGHGDAIRGAMAKAEGVKKGVPDVCLPVPRFAPAVAPLRGSTQLGHGLYIELKRPGAKGVAKGTASAAQLDWGAELQAQGYRFEICVGWEAAARVIEDYMR